MTIDEGKSGWGIRGIQVACLVLAVGLVVLAVRVLVGNLKADYPLEYREPVVVLSTDLLLAGRSPYDIESLPVFMNVYGILYNWVVYPFARLFGSGFAVHRAVSFFFILACTFVLFFLVRREGCSRWLAISAAVAFGAELTFGLSGISRPDSMGLMLLLLAVGLPLVRSFSVGSLVMCSVLSVLAFYTKQYLLVGAPCIALYVFLFRDKAQAVMLGLLTVVLATATALIVARLEPHYFAVTFGAFGAEVTLDPDHLLYHARRFVVLHAPLFVVGCVLAGVGALSLWRSRQRVEFHLWPLRGALISGWRPSLAGYMLLCGLLLMTWLGCNPGQGLLYYRQIVLPFLIWFVVCASRRWRWVVPSALAAQMLLIAAYGAAKVPRLVADHTAEWVAVADVIRPYSRVFHDASTARVVFQQGKTVYQSGHTQSRAIENPLGPDSMTMSSAYRQAVELHLQRIKNGFCNSEFDLVLASPFCDFLNMSLLRHNYVRSASLSLPLPHNNPSMKVEVWKPKCDSPNR